MAGITTNIIFIALVTGIIPTLLWLFFWLREDRFQPEPRGLLALTFIAGVLSVFIVLPLEGFIKSTGIIGTEKIFIFAAVEELVKFGAVFLIDFNLSYLDEPIDYAIYLITGALGFATMENVMFLLSPGLQTDISFIIETGTLRFLGATILHSFLAATLGIILGFVFYKKKFTRTIFIFLGLGVVTILHTIFNYFIIKYVQIDGFLTLGILWVATLIIISLFERVRRVNH
ncbi:MAG: PrsW family glutamic-type intramembrane protease [Candidatus Pacebacteria bacterium]|nr:PrsW family glutamic-type intramembrane protease [Candidatus Paceibacterota bacterium]